MGFRMAPSLLSSDFARLRDEVQAIEAAGADLVHLDVMDNHYVPNLTIGPMICKAIRPHVGIPIDVHLMVRPVDALATAFADAGADIISFHPEASDHVDRTLQVIHGNGCKAGLVLNQATRAVWPGSARARPCSHCRGSPAACDRRGRRPRDGSL